MATVPSQDRLALTHPRTGITVGVYPSSDPKYDIQLYRAASTQGTIQPTSSKFSELATLGVINGGARVSYQDSLAATQTFWWYKAREIRTNVATPSAFTTAVVGQAGVLPTTAPGAIPWSGRPMNASALRFTTNTTLNRPFTKVLTIPAGAFQPAVSTAGGAAGWSFGVLSVTPAQTGKTLELVAGITIPAGVTIVGFSARVFRHSSKDSNQITLSRIAGDAAATLKTLTLTSGNGWHTVASSAMSEAASTTRSYSLDWQGKASSTGSPGNAGLQWAQLIYISTAYHISQ